MKNFKILGVVMGVTMLSMPLSVFADTYSVKISNSETVQVSVPSPVAGQSYDFTYNGQNYTFTLPGEAPKATQPDPNENNTIIGSATTSYEGSSPERAINIDLGVKAVSGTVIKPGETFSFNSVVGDTTPEKGYKEAGVFVGNKVELGYGGGICQVSSTLYDAISKAGIIPTQRHNHSMAVSYVPLGLDATIATPYLDLAFKNPFNYPIRIEGTVQDNKITFNVYSNAKATNGLSYELTSEVIETYEPKSTRVEDPTLPLGQTVQDVPPVTGYKVNVYRNTIQDGKVIKKEFLYTDTYRVVDEVIKVGTKQ